MSISELRIIHLVEQKKKNSVLLQKLKSDPSKLLITILIGNNLANIGAASIATTLSIEFLKNRQITEGTSAGIGIATGIMTLIILIFGEITPKSYCVNNAEKVALFISPAIKIFQILFKPVAFFLNIVTRMTTGDYLSRRYPLVTEEEVRSIVKIGEEEGSIMLEEKEMIHNVLELDDTDVSAVMIPRIDMVTLESTLTIDETIEMLKDKVYSRLPVFEENVDKIIGIGYVKDILHAGLSGHGDKTVKDYVRPAIFVPETMTVNILLKQFKKEKTHIALVVDEHGGIAGLVTIEDVLEELVGEIYDETDKPEELVSPIDDKSFKVMAKINIGDLNEMLEIELLEDESYDTLSGLILHELGKIPEKGETVRISNISLKVHKVEENRIIEVILTKEHVESDAPEED
jgi:CBS domain containing-hemolysin-like protein